MINIQMLTGRSAAQKRDLIAKVAEATTQALGVPDEAIRIILTEVPPEHWAVGGTAKA